MSWYIQNGALTFMQTTKVQARLHKTANLQCQHVQHIGPEEPSDRVLKTVVQQAAEHMHMQWSVQNEINNKHPSCMKQPTSHIPNFDSFLFLPAIFSIENLNVYIPNATKTFLCDIA